MSALTLDRIADLLADTRKRGVYEPIIQDFVDSNELAYDFTANPTFAKMDAASVRNSVKQNVDKRTKDNGWPKMQVILDRTDKENVHVILVNLEKLAEMQAEQNENEAE